MLILLWIVIVVLAVGFVALSHSKWWMGEDESIKTIYVKCYSCGQRKNFSPIQGKCDDCLEEVGG